MRFNYSQLRPYIHFLLEWVRYTCLGNKRVILYLFRCKRSVSGKRKEKVNVWSELLRLGSSISPKSFGKIWVTVRALSARQIYYALSSPSR